MDIVNQPDHRAVNLWLAHGVPQPVFTVQTVPMEHLAQGPAAVRARAHHEREQKRRGYHPHDEGRYIQPPLVRSITEPVATRHRTVHIDLGGWPACPPTEGIRRVSVLLHPTAGAPLGVSAQPSDESGRRYTVALPEDPASVAWLPAGAYRAQVLVWVHGERQPRVWAQTHNPKNGGETPLTVHLEDEPRRPQPRQPGGVGVSGRALYERAARAGDGLAEQTICWGRRGTSARGVALTARDLRLLALLYDVNFLSASQLMLLGWGRDSNAAGRRLRLLHDAGYVDRFRAPAPVGSNEWIYRITPRAFKALIDRGAVADERYRTVELHSISYAEHDLQLNALILHIAQAAIQPGEGGLIERLPFTWLGPRTGRIDPSTDTQHELSPAAALPSDTRLHPEQSRPGYLQPDATLIGGREGERFAVLVEYDRTGRAHKQIDRLRCYGHWLLDGWRHTQFVTHAIPPAVLYVTAQEQSLNGLLQAADHTLTAWQGPPHATAREGTHPGRQRLLFTARTRIVSAEWRMLRAPSLPSAARERAGSAQRAIAYDLSQLFHMPRS